MKGRRLRREEVVTLTVLTEKGANNAEIARLLGVTEGTVRYHRTKLESGQTSSNAKTYKADAVSMVIEHWMEQRGQGNRPVNVKDLFEYLAMEYGYLGSYKSVLRYVRARYGRPKIRTYRRVETPPGAQSQTDWGEFPRIRIAGQEMDLHAFLMVLSHSRKPAVVWSRSEDQLAWLHCHNEAYRRLGGVAAVNRIDNVKTAIAQGAGAWGVINGTYRTYAQAVGFHIDACQPRAANAKGKVESKVKLSRFLLHPQAREWSSIRELQDATDKRILDWEKRATCPATGRTVLESWKAELDRLAKLPILPEPFDIVVTRPVRHDCMVSFEGRAYAVPFEHVGTRVEVRGCAGKVQILEGGKIIREYPRHTAERILIDPSCYEGPATERVIPPAPLGRMGRSLQEILEMPVHTRPIDLYAALAGVAR
jgi:transposase